MASYADLEKRLFQIRDYYGPWARHGDGWMATCPLHGGKPTLHLSLSDQIKAFCFEPSCMHERHAELMERLKTDGWDISEKCLLPADKNKADLWTQNLPAHDQKPLYWQSMELTGYGDDNESFPVTACYTYTDKDGKILFYQLRADTNKVNKKGKREKILKVYSSYRDREGANRWRFSVTFKPRPLYNIKELVDNPTKPVLLVEGEKACEAGKKLFPDYVCVCYSMGMGNWRSTDFKPLDGRDVTFWPDNDEKAIGHFLTVAGTLKPTPKFVYTTKQADRPEGWDIADPVEPGVIESRDLLNEAFVPTSVVTVSLSKVAEITEKYNKHLRTIAMAGKTKIYDKNIVTSDQGSPIPYVYFNTIGDMKPLYIDRAIIDDPKQKKDQPEIEIWWEKSPKIASYGVVYDPTTEEELVKDHNGLVHTNKFMGFENKPKACDPARYQAFIDHVENIMGKTEAKFFLSFLAQMLQQPKSKPGVMPILIGKQVTGKTIIGNIIQSMLGFKNVWVTDGKTFNQKWTGSFSAKLAVIVNEYNRRDQNEDWLNTILTDRTVSFEQKNVATWQEASYHRIIGTTNEGGFSLSSDDRRFFPIEIINKHVDSFNKNRPENKLYFKGLDQLCDDDEGLSGLFDWLLKYKIEMDVTTPPKTAFRDLRMAPRDPVEAIIQEICETSSLPSRFGIYYEKKGSWPEDRSTPAYPFVVLRKHMIDMILGDMDRKHKMTRTGISHSFLRFLRPSTLYSEDAVIALSYYQGTATQKMTDRDRVYEFPPIEELRKRYNELVDPHAVWPAPKKPDLKLVKDNEDDDDKSPI